MLKNINLSIIKYWPLHPYGYLENYQNEFENNEHKNRYLQV